MWGDKSKMHLGQGVDIGGWCGEEPSLMDLWAKLHGREVAGPRLGCWLGYRQDLENRRHYSLD